MKNFKKVISAVIALTMLVSSFATVGASSFSDVADTAAYAEAVDVLYALDIVNGYEENGAFTFKPEGTITRAEAATMIVGALAMTEDAKAAAGTSQFADVNAQAAWATGYINVGVAQKFISGMGDGTFAPMANVTYAQMCVMLTTIAGYGEYAGKNGGWPTGYTSMAAATGINKGVNVGNDTPLTRGQVAQMIYNTLLTPMLGVEQYSIVGNEYAPLDGSNGKFKTLLSDKFGGYAATLQITQTPLADGLANDEVTVQITKADWWPEVVEDKIPNATYTTYSDTYKFVEGIDVNNNLYQTGKAIFVTNEEDELVMIYFKANGRTTTLELPADEYILQSDLGNTRKFSTTNNKIAFDSESPKMDSAGIEIYVNGKSYGTVTPDALPTTTTQDVLDEYLGGARGTIALVKQAGDTYYSKIFVDYYYVGKVTSVEENDGQTTISMTGFKDELTGYAAHDEIVIDNELVEEGTVKLSASKNGEEIELNEIVRGDIIAFATDFTALDYEDPASIDIIVTDEELTGKVTADDAPFYTINGKEYKSFDALTMGTTYKMVLDPFGRIYSAETDGTSVNYAVALKFGTGDETLSVVLADGTKKTLAVADDCAFMIEGVEESASPSPSSNPTTGDVVAAINSTSTAAVDRVIEYKLNSAGELKSINLVAGSPISAEYKSRTNRLGSNPIADSTNVINAEDVANTTKSAGYSTFAVSNFKDGVSYTGEAWGSASYTNFVLLTTVGTKFDATSRFAVLKSDATLEYVDDEEVEVAEVLYEGKVQKLNFEVGITASLNKGDAFFFTTDSYGIIDNVYRVLNVQSETNPVNPLFTNLADVPGVPSISTGDDAWSYRLWEGTGSIQFVEGYVVDVTSNTITLAQVERDATNTATEATGNIVAISALDTNDDIQDQKNAWVSGDYMFDGVAVFGVADDCAAYEFAAWNDNVVGAENRIRVRDAASIKASNFDKFEHATNKGEYADGNAASGSMADYANYAIAMIVDGAVVAIYSIAK